VKLDTIERAGVHELHFHDLRHTFATWLLEAGVDYIVIEKLLGHRLPGTGDLYIHDWDSRLRDAVTRLAVLTEQKLREEIGAWSQTFNATDMSTMYPYAYHHTIPAAFIN
jgi:hypothetical protein